MEPSTESELASRLAELWQAGVPIRGIASQLGLTADQVRGRARKLELPPRYRYRGPSKRESGGVRVEAWHKPASYVDPSLPSRYRPAMRRCLRCQRLFESAHCGNRLCRECAATC